MRELREVTFREITYPTDLAKHDDQLAKIASHEVRTFSLEKRQIRKNGSVAWVNLTLAAVRSGEGKLKYLIAIIEDISSRKHGEEALQEKASLLDLSSDAIVVRDSQDRITYWNNGATEMYGFTAEEVMGRVIHELFATRFPEPLDQIKQKLHTAGRWSGELTHTRKDGSKISVSSRWSVARDTNRELKSILETNRDITAELALRKIQEEITAKKMDIPHASTAA